MHSRPITLKVNTIFANIDKINASIPTRAKLWTQYMRYITDIIIYSSKEYSNTKSNTLVTLMVWTSSFAQLLTAFRK